MPGLICVIGHISVLRMRSYFNSFEVNIVQTAQCLSLKLPVPNVKMSFSKYFLVFATCPNKCTKIKNDSKYISLVFEKTSLNKLRRMFVHLKKP
jgi:hypothetical protein